MVLWLRHSKSSHFIVGIQTSVAHYEYVDPPLDVLVVPVDTLDTFQDTL